MDIHKIITELERLPETLRQSQLEYVEAKDRTERAKLRLKIAHSTALINSKAANATEKKSMADIMTQQESLELIEAETEEAKKEAEFEYASNQFTATRKIANLEEKLYNPNSSGF